VAIALSNRANLLVELRRFDEAVAAADEVIARFGDDPELRERAAAAFATKAAVAATRGSAEAVLDELTSRYASDEDVEVRQWVATAWDGYGQLLAGQGRTDDASRAFEEVDRLFGADPDLANTVGNSLYNAGIAARDAGRLQDAARRLAAVARRYDGLEDEGLRRLVVRCLFNLGIVQRDDGEAVRARATFSQVVLRFHAEADDAIVSWVSRSYDELVCDDSELTAHWAAVAEVMRRRVA
jgi:tetratricopeptide (TPR) repeat protein